MQFLREIRLIRYLQEELYIVLKSRTVYNNLNHANQNASDKIFS